VEKTFIDTNVLVYMYDKRDARKQKIARALVKDKSGAGTAVVSAQVVREFYNACLHKLRIMSADQLQPIIETVLWPMITTTSELKLYENGAKLHNKYHLSFYDALIIQAAIDLDCDILYSEDLQDGQQFGGLTIQNPFTR
jgi:predicted nucleic acid-binding protein